MAAQRVFVVSSVGLTAYHQSRFEAARTLLVRCETRRGSCDFERYLERSPDDVTFVIADVVEEEFREETVPHAFPWERRGLIRARAARVFPGARYLYAERLGREKSGRRDDRIRLSAITRRRGARSLARGDGAACDTSGRHLLARPCSPRRC